MEKFPPLEEFRELIQLARREDLRDDDVTSRLRATNKKVAVGGLLEWLRSIGDHAGNQTALTVVTHPGPARPTDRDVARLGQLQDALVGRRLPVCSNATAREKDHRTSVGVLVGQMRNSRRCADDTRRH